MQRIKNNVTFGFMNPQKDSTFNIDLMKQVKDISIKGFEVNGISNMQSFRDESIDDLNKYCKKGVGSEINSLRNHFYNSLEPNTSITLPDIQAYFGYAFSVGLNKLAKYFTNKEDFSFLDLRVNSEISRKEILQLQYPIFGPNWIRELFLNEVLKVNDVFCDLQDEILVPVVRNSPNDHRLIADAIGCCFIWALYAGWSWFRDIINEISLHIDNDNKETSKIIQVRENIIAFGRTDFIGVLTIKSLLEEEY